MIVGLHTITNATIASDSTTSKDGKGKLNAPVGLSLATMGAILPVGDLVDSSVNGNGFSVNHAKVAFATPGEQVCALQYRKIHHRWFSSNKPDSFCLSKSPRWFSVEIARDEQEGEDDVLEVDAVPLEKHECRQEQRSCEEMEAPDGETLLLCIDERYSIYAVRK